MRHNDRPHRHALIALHPAIVRAIQRPDPAWRPAKPAARQTMQHTAARRHGLQRIDRPGMAARFDGAPPTAARRQARSIARLVPVAARGCAAGDDATMSGARTPPAASPPRHGPARPATRFGAPRSLALRWRRVYVSEESAANQTPPFV